MDTGGVATRDATLVIDRVGQLGQRVRHQKMTNHVSPDYDIVSARHEELDLHF